MRTLSEICGPIGRPPRRAPVVAATDPFGVWVANELVRVHRDLPPSETWWVRSVIVSREADEAFGPGIRWRDDQAFLLAGGARVRLLRMTADGPDVWFDMAIVDRPRSQRTVHAQLTIGLDERQALIYRGLRESALDPREARAAAIDLAA